MAVSSGKPLNTRILVVDDEPDLARTIKMVLDDEGYTVSVCTDGRQALAMITTEEPAVVILDVLMPIIDGFQVLRQLRTHPYGQRLPVILMSGAWRPHEKQWQIGTTLDIAPTVVLPKPFALEDLERCLRQLGFPPQPVAANRHA